MTQDITTADEIKEKFSIGHVSWRQCLIILSCFIVNFVDGFDVIAIALAAPVIADTWNISPQILGYVLSAELVGMMFGAIFLSGLSDKYGRRPVLITSVFWSLSRLM